MNTIGSKADRAAEKHENKTSGHGIVARAAGKALDLVFPQNIYCLCCGDTMESSRIHGICDKCAEKINWLDHDPFRASLEDFAFDHVLSCCVYGFYPRRIMHDLKLHGKPYIARSIGPLMAEKVLTETALTGGVYTALLPVPCTAAKRRKRGYNQAELLAKYAAKQLGLPVWTDVLIKTKETPSMRLSTGEERRNLMQGVFAVDQNTCAKLPGADILLVDDVLTTGSTADACARTLKDAGARTVTVLCFASSARAFEPEWERETNEPEADAGVAAQRQSGRSAAERRAYN
ncbi:MAG: ComF family protein [Firmicutes bacterium]|nr:ComF family protein [Bacillota bacterium]